MSRTKATTKWAAAATIDQINVEMKALTQDREQTKNPMIRASLSKCISILIAELKRRENAELFATMIV